MHQDYKVGEHHANQIIRFINYIIDVIGFLIFTFFIGFLFGILITILNLDVREDDFIYNILAIIAIILYYFLFETFTNGRTLGKFITGTKVVMIDGTKPTTKDYFIRTMCRLIPFEIFSFLLGTGWHDKFSNTAVVKQKDFDSARALDNSIEELGSNL